MLRLIAGEFGGRRIEVPTGSRTRPTAERVREALFSSLGDVSGASVLDLFAGSGAFGFEALSRGASQAVFVDDSRSAIVCLMRNADLLGAGDRAAVSQADWRSAVARLAAEGQQFDAVFVDPPYALAAEVGADLSETLGPVLAPDATVITESAARAPMPTDLPLLRERRYGDTLLRFHGA